MDLESLAARLRVFAEERDWDQFHTPKNLAIAVATEASELLEIFQWSRGTGGWEELQERRLRLRAEEELADVLLYLIRFADRAGIDLEAACLAKLDSNAKKYPAELARGSDKKYDELR